MSGGGPRLDARAMLLMVVLCAVWGVQQVAIKVVGAEVPPLTQAAIRSIGATLLVWLWCRSRGEVLFARDGSLGPGLAVAALFTIEFAFLFAALHYTTASRGVLLLYTAPFFIALSAPWLLPGERLRWLQWVGLAAAFGGVVLLFGDKAGIAGDQQWLGDFMMLLAALFWAATTLTIKVTRLARLGSNKVLLYQLAGSAIAFPLAAWTVGEPGVGRLTPLILAGLTYQTVVVAGLSYVGWFWLIKHYPATRLAVFSFMTPVFGVLAGWLLLDEALTTSVMGAMALVGSGIVLVNWRTR